MLACRVTSSYDSLKDMWPALEGNSKGLVVYEHPADEKIERTHVHFLIVECGVSTDTLKNWIKKVLKVQSFPKTDWSFKTTYKDHDDKEVAVDFNFITYMTKGHLEPKLVSNVESIEEYKKNWKSRTNVKGVKVQYKLVQENPAVAKKRKYDTLKYMMGKVKPTDSNDEIIKIIRDVLIEYHEVVGVYKVLDYYDTIIMHVRPSNFLESVNNLLDKRKPRN